MFPRTFFAYISHQPDLSHTAREMPACWSASTANYDRAMRHTSRKRSSHDPLGSVNAPTWLVVRDRVNTVLQSTQLAPAGWLTILGVRAGSSSQAGTGTESGWLSRMCSGTRWAKQYAWALRSADRGHIRGWLCCGAGPQLA